MPFPPFAKSCGFRSHPTDVAIVGAGPAGSALACLLARAGLRVRLIDRQRFPRDKVCGDFLGPRCLPLLHRLGALSDVEATAGCRVQGMRLHSERGRVVEARYDLLPGGPRYGLGIERAALDALLLEHARAAGAEVVLGRAVDPLSLVQGLVVGADGRGSRVAQAFGIGRKARLGSYALRAYMDAGPALDDMGEIHLAPWGYVGLGIVGHGRVNVAVVMKRRRRLTFEAALASVPSLRGKIGGQPAALRAAAPLSHVPRAVTNGRALLVGDAAQALDPVTGEGVYHALRSAELAAESIVPALTGSELGPHLARYARAHAAEFRPRLTVSRAIARLLPNRFVTEPAACLLGRTPRLAARLIGYAGNVVTLSEALLPDSGPRYQATEARS